ncbi:DUF2378 family protein [Myxococcaceae bacterium JPH2]|nr:DUF2378 family protein [Myxococcaceae bacterium JPH2]
MTVYAARRAVSSGPAEELQMRWALTTPEDRVRGMFFLGVLEVIRNSVGIEAAEECLACTGERRFVPFLMYPVAAFLHMSFRAASMLAPRKGGFDRAMRAIGAQATSDFLSSLVGRSFLMLAASDPRRLVTNLPSGYRTVVSYGERHVTWSGPSSGCLRVARDFMPHTYHEGVLQAVLEAIGTQSPMVHGKATGLLDCDYSMSWE